MTAPMLASIGGELPSAASGEWVFEPKYDGVRVLAHATKDDVALVSRNGIDKAHQFPEIGEAMRALATRKRRALVLDGEIVALRDGEPARFQELQSRMHVIDTNAIRAHREETPAALIVFDLLVDGEASLVERPWRERRKRLEALLNKL